MWSNKPISDVEALQQAIQPFLQQYEVIRHKVQTYNERGRVDDIVKKETITAFIKPNGSRLNTQQPEGMGRRVTNDYTITCVVPEYFNQGDIIIHPVYGRLKVNTINDNRYQGMMSGGLIRTGTTNNKKAQSNHLYEPD